MMVSARSYLTAGLAAGLVLAATGAPVVTPTAGPPPITVASPGVELSAALTSLLPQLPSVDLGGFGESPGDWIINAYGVIQPWVEYGVELFAWATEWLPWPIGLLAPQADIIYSGWQPFAESVVYSFAFLVDGEFDLILPTLSAGIQTGVTNIVQGEIAWILSFFPPLPPIGFAAAAATTTTIASRTAPPAPAAEPEAAQAVAAEAQPAAVEVAEAQPAAVEVAEPQPAAVEVAEPQPAAVEVTEPEAAPKSTRQASRGTARVPRSVPAVPAAAVTDILAAPAEATTSPAPEPKARKASRAADSNTTSNRAARADRAAR